MSILAPGNHSAGNVRREVRNAIDDEGRLRADLLEDSLYFTDGHAGHCGNVPERFEVNGFAHETVPFVGVNPSRHPRPQFQ